MTPPITATPAQPAAITSATRSELMPPMARSGTLAARAGFGEPLTADFRAVARLAHGLEGGACEGIVDDRRDRSLRPR